MRKSHFFHRHLKINKWRATSDIPYSSCCAQQQQAASKSIMLTFSLSFVTVWNQILPMAEINLCESAKCVSICLEFMLTYRNASRSFDLSDAKCDRIECTSRWLLITCFCFCCHSLARSLSLSLVHYVFVCAFVFSVVLILIYYIYLSINHVAICSNLFVCVYMHCV